MSSACPIQTNPPVQAAVVLIASKPIPLRTVGPQFDVAVRMRPDLVGLKDENCSRRSVPFHQVSKEGRSPRVSTSSSARRAARNWAGTGTQGD
jgi:hypothetical protein